MGSSHDGANPSLAFGYSRERDPSPENAFFEQLAGEVHRKLAIADNDRRDRSLACGRGPSAYIESKQLQFFFPEARVLPELFHALRFIFEHVEGGDTCRRHGRWMRSREQKRPGPVIEKVNQIARAADVSTERANGFRQRSDLNIHAPVHFEMIDCSSAVFAEDA